MPIERSIKSSVGRSAAMSGSTAGSKKVTTPRDTRINSLVNKLDIKWALDQFEVRGNREGYRRTLIARKSFTYSVIHSCSCRSKYILAKQNSCHNMLTVRVLRFDFAVHLFSAEYRAFISLCSLAMVSPYCNSLFN